MSPVCEVDQMTGKCIDLHPCCGVEFARQVMLQALYVSCCPSKAHCPSAAMQLCILGIDATKLMRFDILPWLAGIECCWSSAGECQLAYQVPVPCILRIFLP